MTASFLQQPETSDAAHEAELAALGPERISPARLLERGTEFERQLLGASPPNMPAASRERLARALQLPEVIAEGAAASGSAAPGAAGVVRAGADAAGTLARWSKLATVAVLGGVVLGGAPLARRWSDAERVAAVQLPAAFEVARVSPPEPATSAAPAHVAWPQEVAAPLVPAAAVPRPTAPRAAKPVPKRVEERGLRAELRALESSQTALAAGRSAEAQQALDDYAARFPQGELAMEAALLQIDVSLARGERRRARELARALASRPEAARYRERLQVLLSDAAGRAAVRNGAAANDGETR